MVKFVSPQEFYDWCDANREELGAFHSFHTPWEGIRKFFEIQSHLGYPFSQLTEEHKYWSRFSDEYPPDKKQEVMQEDEIYIVSNIGGWNQRNNKWWVIYIPNSLYKVNHSISSPFEKETWWRGSGGTNGTTSRLDWVQGFIKYDKAITLFTTLNYPGGL